MSSSDIAIATATAAAPAQTDLSGDIVKLETKDKDIVAVPVETLKLSKTLTDLLEDAADDIYKGTSIPLHSIRTVILKGIIEYLNHHNEFPSEHIEYANKGLDEIAEWDVAFCEKMNNNVLFETILASNYLNIESLLKLTCKIVARKIKGKKADEIREILKLEPETA